jgi:hypothetical protein
MATDDLLTYRDQLRMRMPWWLRGWLGGRLIYAIGIQLDVLADMAVNAVGLRFPRAAQPDALAGIGQDRKIPRGRSEPAATYAARLRRWLDDHRTRGGPYAMLAQLHAFWGADPFQIWLYYASGKGFAMSTAGVITNSANSPVVGDWARWWLYFEWPDAVASDGLWSDPGTWSDGGVWDSGLTPNEVEDIRNVPREWNAAHATGTIILIDPTTHQTSIGVGQ